MSQIIITIFMLINGIIFSKMIHPMNMGIMLLIQTLLVCLLTAHFAHTTWFSYILFLVFLGGMLVLFIYMTSIASNEVFQKSKYLMILFISSFIFFIMMIMYFMDYMMMYYNNTTETINTMNMFKTLETLDLMNLYNMPNAMITTFMVLYLFLTLIVIVYLTKSHQGPLRPSN